MPGYRPDKTEDIATAKALLADAGYPEGDIQEARKMLTKQGIKRDPEVRPISPPKPGTPA